MTFYPTTFHQQTDPYFERFVCLFITAQSTAQGHLRAFQGHTEFRYKNQSPLIAEINLLLNQRNSELQTI